jgi:hypothetical protein
MDPRHDFLRPVLDDNFDRYVSVILTVSASAAGAPAAIKAATNSPPAMSLT